MPAEVCALVKEPARKNPRWADQAEHDAEGGGVQQGDESEQRPGLHPVRPVQVVIIVLTMPWRPAPGAPLLQLA